MIALNVTGVEHVRENLSKAAKNTLLAQESGIKRASILISRELKEHALSEQGGHHPFWGTTGSRGDGLSARTGKTRASITGGGQIYRVGSIVSATIGSPDKHLKQHEEGGKFDGGSPRGFFRIPTAEAQTGAGADKYAGQSIREIAGAFLVRTMGGRLFAAVSRGKNRIAFLYMLVRHINLKPRHIFARTRAKMQPAVVAVMYGEVSVVVQQANK